jgi:hypothetical protein
MWSKLSRLSPTEARYLGRAVIELAYARLRHAVLPASAILAALQDGHAEIGGNETAPTDVRLVAWSIAAASGRVPWRADCLICAMAADRWLRRQGRQPEFILGVATNGGMFQAHAWLRCEGMAITGGTGDGFSRILAARGD